MLNWDEGAYMLSNSMLLFRKEKIEKIRVN